VSFRPAITTGGQPVAQTGGDGLVWVADASGKAVRIDTASNTAIGEPISVGGRAQDVAFGEGAVWVVDQLGNTLVRVEA
jgi:DNA-binding beta-propeller fold protein YncE